MKILTIVLIIVAIATALLAYTPRNEVASDDSGPRFFGPPIIDYDEAAAEARRVADLEIVTYDPNTATERQFQVSKKDGIWTIPSHHNYPADGAKRVGSIAGSVLGVERGSLITSDPVQHAEFVVSDPRDQSLPVDEERGQRVILKDGQGATMLDIIIGKPSSQNANLRYVREAEDNAVYLAKINPNLTTRFTDFVDTDLLKIIRDTIRSMSLDHHSVDELLNQVRPGEKATFYRLSSDSEWVDDQLPQGKQVSQAKVDELAVATGRIVLQGVRPSGADMDPNDRARLFADYGFFGAQDGLKGNEGGLTIQTADGLSFFIFFGEIASGEGDALTAGSGLPEDGLTREEIIANRVREGDNRHIAVFVVYDQGKDEAFAKIPEDREGVFRGLEGIAADAELSEEQRAKLAEAINTNRDEHLKLREEQLVQLREKFGRFFFIISDDVFRQLHPSIPGLYEAAPEPISMDAEAGPGEAPAAVAPLPAAEEPATTAPAP